MLLNVPFRRLLSRLSVGRKLMLIYLLDLTAVIYVSGILINEKFIAIDFARKELAGSAYVATIRDGLLGAALAPGDAQQATLDALTRAEASHGAGMRSADSVAALRSAHAALGATAAPQREAALEQLLARGRELVTRVGNQSNLILDPDLDSYYTMSLVVLRYPELLELSHAMTRLLAAQASGDMPRGDARTAYLILEGKVDALRQGISSDVAEATAAGRPTLRDSLEPPHDQLLRALSAWLAQTRLAIEGAKPQPADAQLAQQTLLHALRDTWAAGSSALDRLVQARVDSLVRRMWLDLGTALALLSAILLIVYKVARQIAPPLRALAGIADTVRRTGDRSLRAQWDSRDEIGRLVVGFNDMLAELDRVQEAQKELAASARAADAQRALVEATPIPLMVTAIPGHDVLHANPPGRAWLAGQTQDPWRLGLESAVRQRFFQQLQDRGTVDEFEVRWLAGSEPAWALLSARRVQFQGQDAVLTTFAPINHLKLMERRLELWAKVFEASSEGILIVDAQHRILSANHALTRHTGYELQEVAGQTPAMLLAPGEPALVDAMWAQLGTRGSRGVWQGELPVRRRNGSEYPAWVMVNAVRVNAVRVNALRVSAARGPAARQGQARVAQDMGSGHGHGSGHDTEERSQAEVSHYIVTSIDISDRKKSEQRIRFLAGHDVLTELPNRATCVERLRMAMQQATRMGHKVALLFIDLDRFKDINDTLGHPVGDGLLQSVAARLQESVRAGDTVSRQGGDEFVVVLSAVQDIAEVAQVVEERLIPLIRRPHMVEGTELHVSCSVGVAIFPDDTQDLDVLMRHADTAMYHAKAAGKDGAQFFTAAMTERAQARRLLETELRRALELQQFRLEWQPQVAAADGALVGAEALLRWAHPERGLVQPSEFIALAEETGLVVPIGAWVIDEACRQWAVWRRAGLAPFTVAINLSVAQLRDDGLAAHVRAALERHAVPPAMLELELTETMVMDDAERTLRQLHALRALGVGLAIDDFGTGYSSLAYLNRFPISKLKIDRSFVHDMLHDSGDRAITMAVIGLGHTLGLQVVAEGVEHSGEAALLREARCDVFQGFLYARPMAADALVRWVQQRPGIVGQQAPAGAENVLVG